jgi:hypothetical protein
MEKNIAKIHASIQYFESIGSWGMAQVLRKILASMLVASVVVLSGCATTYVRKYTVHPDDRARFDVDFGICTNRALAFHQGDDFVDSCMRLKGYQLNIVAQ